MSHNGQMIVGESTAKDWFYKGEGAANLVLGYCGSSPFLTKRCQFDVFMKLVGKVLRIQKISNKKTLSAGKGLGLSNQEKLIWKDVGEILESATRDFAARAFIQHVMIDLLNSKHRCGGTPKCDFCIAVEIKPKCGFLPSSEYITEANAIKKNVTRFKMHQFLKHHRGEAIFIDLDLKPLDKMAHYYELDQKIVNFYKMNQEIEQK